MANTVNKPSPGKSTRPPSAAGGTDTRKGSVNPTRKPGGKSTVRTSGNTSVRPAGRATTRSVPVAQGRFSSSRQQPQKKSTFPIYIFSGMIIGIGILYLMFGGNSESSPPPRRPAPEGSHHRVSSNFVPPKISEKTVSDRVTVIRRKATPATPADEAAIKKLAEAQAIYEIGNNREGEERNDYFRHVAEMCNEIIDANGISDHVKQEAGRLKYSARKSQTL